eukprot:4187033-Pleurochrysis_carterae.AAC.1
MPAHGVSCDEHRSSMFPSKFRPLALVWMQGGFRKEKRNTAISFHLEPPRIARLEALSVSLSARTRRRQAAAKRADKGDGSRLTLLISIARPIPVYNSTINGAAARSRSLKRSRTNELTD